MTETRARLKALRRLMTQKGVAAYLIPSTDPHQSEYVPAFWERRKWLSGFTGSAAVAAQKFVIANDDGVVFCFGAAKK